MANAGSVLVEVVSAGQPGRAQHEEVRVRCHSRRFGCAGQPLRLMPLPRPARAPQAHLRAWEARLVAREASLLAREARACSDAEASRRSSLLLAHAGDWTVRGGSLFTRAADSGWSVRGGNVYARVDAQSMMLADAHDAAPDGSTPPLPPPAPAELTRPSFLAKCRGAGFGGMPRGTMREAGASGVTAAFGICALAALQVGPVSHHGLLMLVASFGASAVLLFAAPASPLAQPRNLVFGNTISALAGVCVARAFAGSVTWLAPGIAVGVATFFMCLAGVTHPPGGAFALIAVIGGDVVRAQDFLYVLLPALSGSLILLLIAILCNNLHPARQYPSRW
jgi:hypothetical protein